MPVSVCEPVANVSAVLRESLGNGYSSNGRSICKTGGVGDNYNADDDGCLQTKLAVTAKRVLLSKIEYEEVPHYGQSVLGALKSKYDILKGNTANKNLNYDYLSIGKNSEQNDTSANASPSNGTSSISKRQNPNELPQPKRVLYPRENVIIGWKNSIRKWQVGVGMMNVGNTCYLNSTLQALFHVPSMANWLISDAKHIEECNSSENCIICAMIKTLEASQNNQTAIRPYLVYSKLKFICKHLLMGRQEDAHEFLRYLVEAMEKCFLTRFRNYKELDQYSKETTPLNQILGGYLKSAVRCLSCGHVSVTFQHFQDLLLDIRKADTIEDALEGYFSRERLEDMGYKCEACKKKVSATKQFSLERAPIVLCIQLKRFSVMGTKLNKQITIKPRVDLSKFASRKDVGEQLTYKLVAMVTHLGASQHCGHYTAIGLTESGSYYNYDDSYVRPVSVQNVCNTNAYILFYEIDKCQRTQNNTELSSLSENSPKQNGYSKIENLFSTEISSSNNSLQRLDSNLLTGAIKSTPSYCINKPSTCNGSTTSKSAGSRQLQFKTQTNSTPLKSSDSPATKLSINSENRSNNQRSTEQNTSTLLGKHNDSKDVEKKSNSPTIDNQVGTANEKKRSKASELLGPAPKPCATLPSMPNIADVQNQNLNQPAKYSVVPVTSLKSLVPYESETDEESTASEVKDVLLGTEESDKKKTDIKCAVKRPLESTLQNTTATADNFKQKKIPLLSENDQNPGNKQTTSCKLDFNTNKSDETNTNRSKGKQKVDIFDEIFNQKKCVSSKDGVTSSEDFINKSHDEEECDDHLVTSSVSRPPFVRSQSTPPSPPVIKTKTGLWQVTTLQPVTACISPPEKKVLKNVKNPFAKKSVETFNKRSKPSQEVKTERTNAGHGYRCSSITDDSVSGLLKQSHRGYGVPVLSWKGEQTKISKEVEIDAQQQRQHDWQNDEDAEIDRGRQKKVRKESSSQSDNRIPGFNPFQEQENQRRWRANGVPHRHYSGYVRQQFQRSKFKFQRFNPKFQRMTAMSYKRNNHRLNSSYTRRNS